MGLFDLLGKKRKDREKAKHLIDSMLRNCKQNLGVEPDAASIQWMAEHPAFAAFIWDIFEVPEYQVYLGWKQPQAELRRKLEAIIPYGRFKATYPAAAAIFDHAVRWFDSVGSLDADAKHLSPEQAQAARITAEAIRRMRGE